MFHKTMTVVPLLVSAMLLGQTGGAFSFQPSSSSSSSSSSADGAVGTGNVTSRKNFLQASGLALTSFVLIPQSSRAAVQQQQLLPDVVGGKIRFGDEDIMSPKEHGTSVQPVQSDLKFGVNNKLADKICNYNRHFAEMGGYFQSTPFETVVMEAKGPVTFYDSVTGKALFVAPINRSAEDFIKESKIHGWPSFRDSEVVWENVRVLKGSGETVSVDGTHLGHNLPDRSGNRYCINLVSVAGNPIAS